MGWRSAGLSKSLFGPISSAPLLSPRAAPVVPARGAAIPPPAQKGCYALRRLGDIPGAAGDVRLGLPLQAISFCIHIAAEGQGSPLAGEAAHNQGSIPLLWPRFLISSPQASAADRCQTRGNPATLFPTGPSKPLEMLLLFMKIGSGSCCQLLPELQRHPCHRGSYRKTLRNGTAGTR